MKITNDHIFDFNGEWIPTNRRNPDYEGYYMTIRCGLNGIYTCPNEWKDNRWQMEATDASRTIAFSREQISEEEVNEWAGALLKKVVTNLSEFINA